jgi:hypothetical protein
MDINQTIYIYCLSSIIKPRCIVAEFTRFRVGLFPKKPVELRTVLSNPNMNPYLPKILSYWRIMPFRAPAREDCLIHCLHIRHQNEWYFVLISCVRIRIFRRSQGYVQRITIQSGL